MPPPRTSPIWEHFAHLRKNRAACRYCEKVVVQTDHSTSNLARHLSDCKPEEYAKYDKAVIDKKKEKEAKKRRLEVRTNSATIRESVY